MRQISREMDCNFKPISYSEEDQDWETSGEEEMQKEYEKCKKNTAAVLARDELSTLRDMIRVCVAAIGNEDYIINDAIQNVLHFHVLERIKIADEELAGL
jgi:hypothetical protein